MDRVDGEASGARSGTGGRDGSGGATAMGGRTSTGGAGGAGGRVSIDGGPVGSGGSGSADPDAAAAGRPHPLYPPLDLDSMPGDRGGATGPYEPPELPRTSRTVTVQTTGTEARNDLVEACSAAGTEATVPDGAGHLGVVDLGHVTDCDITLGPNVTADLVYVGHLPGPEIAPAHRVRVRGGRLGGITVDPGSTDIVFDGVIVDNDVGGAASRSGVAIYLIGDPNDFVDRFAFVNSIIRMLPTLPDGAGNTDGCAYLAGSARNVFFANDNVATAGNRNSWGFRLGGGDNFVIVDSTVRVSFHKLIRMNDGPVDYVFVKGGTWLREETVTVGGDELNDAFAQLGDLGTDHVYIHDPEIYLLSDQRVSFGASSGPGQAGKSWEARRIAWHARSPEVVSEALVTEMESYCDPQALCDYGAGTHTYAYDSDLAFPQDPWRALPDLAANDPDEL